MLKKMIMAAALVMSVFVAAPSHAEDGKFYTGFGAGGAFNDYAGIKDQGDVNLKAGKDFGMVRLELGYDYLRSDVLKGNMVSGAVLVEPFAIGSLQPYAGAGVGYVWLNDRATEGVDNHSDVAFMLIAGANYPLTSSWDVFGEYRWVTSEAQTSTIDDTTEDYAAHIVTAGVKYNF